MILVAQPAVSQTTVEEHEAARLDSALGIVAGFGAHEPMDPRDCYVSLDVIEQHSDNRLLPGVGYANEGAMRALAAELDSVCSVGLRSNLETYGLQKLVEDALDSRTTAGGSLEDLLNRLESHRRGG